MCVCVRAGYKNSVQLPELDPVRYFLSFRSVLVHVKNNQISNMEFRLTRHIFVTTVLLLWSRFSLANVAKMDKTIKNLIDLQQLDSFMLGPDTSRVVSRFHRYAPAIYFPNVSHKKPVHNFRVFGNTHRVRAAGVILRTREICRV